MILEIALGIVLAIFIIAVLCGMLNLMGEML